MTDTAPKTRPDLSVLRMNREDEPPRRRWRFLPWLIVLVVLAALALVAIRLPLPFLLPQVETATVQVLTPTEASTVLTATGYTYARTRAAVGSKIIGRVTDLRVDEGDRVRRGEVIAVLDSVDLQAAVRRAEAALGEAQARLADAVREEQRQRRMVEAEVAPSAELDAAVTRLEIARAQIETAQSGLDSVKAQLDYTIIRSPIDGVVIQRNVEVGEMVAPGGFTSQQSTGAIVRIADPGSLEVEADINESFIARIQLGQPATIRVDAVPGVDFRGRLRQIVPTADRQRAVVEVKVSIEDPEQRLVPDMSCSVTFLEEGTDATTLLAAPKILVDRRALRTEGRNHFVFRLEDGRVAKTLVELAEATEASANNSTNRGTVEVRSGLAGGQVVVLDPPADLEDGARVRARS